MMRLASLGFEVHARCAAAILRDEPPPLGDSDDPDDTLDGGLRLAW